MSPTWTTTSFFWLICTQSPTCFNLIHAVRYVFSSCSTLPNLAQYNKVTGIEVRFLIFNGDSGKSPCHKIAMTSQISINIKYYFPHEMICFGDI